jgi:tetratricopeptide (TPR) repeat protein
MNESMKIWKSKLVDFSSYQNVYLYCYESKYLENVCDMFLVALKSNSINGKVLNMMEYVELLLNDNNKSDSDLFLLFNLNNYVLDDIPKNYIVIQTEQYMNFNEKYINLLKQAIDIWDHSFYNLNLLKSEHNINGSLIPYGHINSISNIAIDYGNIKIEEIDDTEEILDSKVVKTNEVIIFGEKTERINRIINNLKYNNVSVVYTNNSSELIDIVDTSKIFLNLHSADGNSLELSTIYPLLYKDIMVISEKSIDTKLDNLFGDIILFSDEDNIQRICCSYLLNENKRITYIKNAHEKWQTIDMEKIINNYINNRNMYRCLPSYKNTQSLLSVCCMVKNEIETIESTLISCIDHVDKVIILDTGSTDGTQDKIREFCNKHNKPLVLKEFPFIDFSTNKNKLLEIAKDETIYALIMDAADELINAQDLYNFCLNDTTNEECFLINMNTGNLTFGSSRLVKTGNGWYYTGRVHELLCKANKWAMVTVPNVCIKHIKTNINDIKKSQNRYSNDKVVLYEEHLKNPKDARTVFYLAQTYECLGDLKNAFKYYEKRIDMTGNIEEKFYAYYKCGIIYENTNEPWEKCLYYYLKAFQICKRIEPLMQIVGYYKNHDYFLAYMYCKLATDIPYPRYYNLFINSFQYNYDRWAQMEMVASFAALEISKLTDQNYRDTEYYNIGKKAMQIAYDNAPNADQKDLMKRHGSFYELKF